MKKIFLLTALIISINLAGQDFRIGINFDPVISWFSPNTKHIDKAGAKLGFSGGLMVEKNFKQNYAFATGLDLTYMGGNLQYNNGPTTFTVDKDTKIDLDSATTVEYALQFISIPLALKLKTNEVGYITYFGQLGLTPQFNISAKATSDKGNLLDKDNVGEEIGLFNLSFFIGGGIDYNLGGTTALNIGIFYNNGFIDLLSNDEYKAAMNYVNLRLGVMF
jgi:Outer membrane protein beta-barrel domain